VKGRRAHHVAGLLVGLALLLGCGSAGDSGGTEARPLFVYVSPDPLGVNPFLLMGQTGIEAAAERLGADALVLESEDPMSREENLRAAVYEGAELVVVLGFEFNDFLPSLAAEAPDVDFLVVDHCLDGAPDNVYCAVFREFDGSFLIGAIAGLLSESGRVGAIGVADIPFLHRYTDGFAAGVAHVRPDAEISIRWVGGENPFADPVRAKEQALALAAAGVDHIYTAAAAGNLGVFEAAAEKGFHAYGIDVDQCPSAPGQVVDNMMKRVDRVIVEAAEAIQGRSAERMLVYGLGSGGLDLTALEASPEAESQCTILEHPEVIERVRELAAQIEAGEIGIEDPMGIL
jgi:basic membrane protein A